MMKRSEIEAELQRETAYSRVNDGNYSAMDGVDRTRAFHLAMGLPVRSEPAIPSVSERILRAKLLLEETLETIEKGLGLRIQVQRGNINEERNIEILHGEGAESDWGFFTINHEEGVKYDPIETLDGLADVKVIANGTAVQFGLPLHEAEYEVWCSNMTKLDESGKPVINQCKHFGGDKDPGIVVGYDLKAMPDISMCTNRERTNDCDDVNHFIDPSKPKGKLLKPDTYVPANIVRIFERFAGDENENVNRAWLLTHGEHE